MAIAAKEQARIDEINAALRDNKTFRTAGERRELVNELNGLLAPPPPRPEITPEVAALVTRAERLGRAMHSHQWSGPDHRVIAEQFAEVLLRLPDGAYVPPAFSAPPTRPVAILPTDLSRKFADPVLTGAARESAIGYRARGAGPECLAGNMKADRQRAVAPLRAETAALEMEIAIAAAAGRLGSGSAELAVPDSALMAIEEHARVLDVIGDGADAIAGLLAKEQQP